MTPETSARFSTYAGILAEAAGLTDEEVQASGLLALLHDIGNMAGPSTSVEARLADAEESKRVKIDPCVGAGILGNVCSARGQ